MFVISVFRSNITIEGIMIYVCVSVFRSNITIEGIMICLLFLFSEVILL
jgi:hypothetical protein